MGLNLIPKAESSQVLQLASSSARHVQQPVKGQIQVKRLRRLQAVLPLLEKLVLVSTNKAPLDELADLLGVAAPQLRLSKQLYPLFKPRSRPCGVPSGSESGICCTYMARYCTSGSWETGPRGE